MASQYQHELKGLIVENTFTSISDMVLVLAQQALKHHHYKAIAGLLPTFLSIFMASHWKSSELIHHVQAPILFISSDSDELIPKQQMQLLQQHATASKFTELYSVKGATHNDAYMRGGTEYYQRIKAFMDKCLKQDAS